MATLLEPNLNAQRHLAQRLIQMEGDRADEVGTFKSKTAEVIIGIAFLAIDHEPSMAALATRSTRISEPLAIWTELERILNNAIELQAFLSIHHNQLFLFAPCDAGEARRLFALKRTLESLPIPSNRGPSF